MASVNVALSGKSTGINGKPYTKPLENGVLPAVAEKLDLQETRDVMGDATEAADEEEPRMGEIKQDLDTLSLTGSAINDLEIELTKVKVQHRRTVNEARKKLEYLRKKLGSNIKKSEPFIEIWRKARQVQELSNKAAARFDKANSQYMAAKEMIHMSEAQLSKVNTDEQDPSSPSPIDLAWQEMLNHATIKVVKTEKERRESEVEHKRIMEECNRVMEEYKHTEMRLRSHIIKSRPYYEERYRYNQTLQQLKLRIQSLENQLAVRKKTYAGVLKKLELLNTEIHRRRASTLSVQRIHHLDSRKSFSTGNSPEPMRTRPGIRAMGGSGSLVSASSMERMSDTESVSSLQLGDLKDQFSGSTGSLPSIGASSVSEISVSSTPTPDQSFDEENPVIINGENQEATANNVPQISRHELPKLKVNSEPVNNIAKDDCTCVDDSQSDAFEEIARRLVQQTLTTAVSKMEEQRSTLNPLTLTPKS